LWRKKTEKEKEEMLGKGKDFFGGNEKQRRK